MTRLVERGSVFDVVVLILELRVSRSLRAFISWKTILFNIVV